MEIMKGVKLRRQGGSGRHGDDEGKHMKGDKAAGAAKSSTEWGDRLFLAWRWIGEAGPWPVAGG